MMRLKLYWDEITKTQISRINHYQREILKSSLIQGTSTKNQSTQYIVRSTKIQGTKKKVMILYYNLL